MSTLSQETRNRVLMWLSVLETAYEDIRASECFRDTFKAVRLVHDENIKAFSQNEKCIAKSALVAQFSLIDHAVVLFCQLFVSGRSGPGFAANSADEVKQIRSEMEQYVIRAMKCSEHQYKELKGRILSARHTLVGHYDGEAAGFHYIAPGISARAIAGANLSGTEIEEFRLLIMAMILYFREELLPRIRSEFARPDKKGQAGELDTGNDC